MKITVIGGGPGGYVAAITAAKLGAQVTIVEKAQFGGTCLNVGCIPTKAYLQTAELLCQCCQASKYGIAGLGSPSVSFADTYRYKEQTVRQLVHGVEFLLRKNRVTVLRGAGKIVSKGLVRVANVNGGVTEVESDAIILATGSAPVLPPLFRYDGQRVISSSELIKMQKQPDSLLIVGGGVIGCEFGQFFSRLGTTVTIVEMEKQLLPHEDEDVAGELRKSLAADQVKIYTDTAVTGVEKSDAHITACLSSGERIEAEYMLVAIGRRPVMQGLWENVDIRTENGAVAVDEFMRTSLSGVYAIGDLVATPALAHVASCEGIAAVRHILGAGSRPMDYRAVPRCVYTSPQVAVTGMTEKELQARNTAYRTGRFSFLGLGKAIVSGHTEGFVKLLTSEDDVIVGAQIVGDCAVELLAELTMAVELGLRAEQVGGIIHPHPSLSEAIMEAAHAVHGVSVHCV